MSEAPSTNLGLSREELEDVSRRTLTAYSEEAEEFWESTRDHDVSQNQQALLRALGGSGPFRILDLGCGPGRDLRAFRELGQLPVGLDGSSAFVEMARKFSGCEVWHQDFLSLDLPAGHFHGVFANATLQHVPEQELPRVLADLGACLQPQGVLFCSLPRGENEEGFRGDRFSHFWDYESWRSYLVGAGFLEVEHFYRPSGKPREEQPWLATVWRWPGPELAPLPSDLAP